MTIFRIITQKIREFKKTSSNNSQKKKNEQSDSFFQKLWQKIIKNFQKHNAISLQKKKKSDNKKAKTAEKEKLNNKESRSEYNSIEKLLHEYEKMIKHDFFAVISNARANLRRWHSDLMLAISNSHQISDSVLEELSVNLLELQELFHNTNHLLNKFVDKCAQYDEIVKNAKSLITPNQQLNKANLCLSRIKRNLEQGQKMTTLVNDPEFKFLSNYLHEKGFKSNSRSLF
jgi:hypothetical protein